MTGPITQGWYRRARDAGHIVHRVSGREGSWLTCMFDLRSGYPCGNGFVLTDEAWNSFRPTNRTPPLPN